MEATDRLRRAGLTSGMAVVLAGGATACAATASGPDGPAWRALLEARWRARLQEVTELSLAYHEAAAVPPAGRPGDRRLRQLLRRAVTARRALADTDEALGRLSAGRYGLCEGCLATIPDRVLAGVPEARYCPRCQPAPAAERFATMHQVTA